MEKFFKSNYNLSILIFRVLISILMITHGFPKLQNLISGNFGFYSFLGLGALFTLILAVISEFVAPIFIILGYKTRLATIFPILTMLVVVFIVHFSEPLKSKEIALMYLFSFGLILFTGAGKYSIDKD